MTTVTGMCRAASLGGTDSMGPLGDGVPADPYIMHFNASWSNSTYGNSTTVTPLSRKCRYLIRY